MSGSLSSSAAAAQDARFRVVWSRQRVELSHFSTAAQSELFDTDSESDTAQCQQMPGAFKPPAPQRPCGMRACVQDPSEARTSWGLFHAALSGLHQSVTRPIQA
jgi:hypothetical protein